jgi:hypothetical protein
MANPFNIFVLSYTLQYEIKVAVQAYKGDMDCDLIFSHSEYFENSVPKNIQFAYVSISSIIHSTIKQLYFN